MIINMLWNPAKKMEKCMEDKEKGQLAEKENMIFKDSEWFSCFVSVIAMVTVIIPLIFFLYGRNLFEFDYEKYPENEADNLFYESDEFLVIYPITAKESLKKKIDLNINSTTVPNTEKSPIAALKSKEESLAEKVSKLSPDKVLLVEIAHRGNASEREILEKTIIKIYGKFSNFDVVTEIPHIITDIEPKLRNFFQGPSKGMLNAVGEICNSVMSKIFLRLTFKYFPNEIDKIEYAVCKFMYDMAA